MRTLLRTPAGMNMTKYLLKLYIAGQSPRSQRAILNLRRICDSQNEFEYELDIVDVLKRPELAEEHKVMATPMLIKELPPPIRRIIGDMTDMEKVLVGLEIDRCGEEGSL
jgi:circadian clock protein KaiB